MARRTRMQREGSGEKRDYPKSNPGKGIPNTRANQAGAPRSEPLWLRRRNADSLEQHAFLHIPALLCNGCCIIHDPPAEFLIARK